MGVLSRQLLAWRVPRSSREIVRSAVGLAVVLPAIGLLVLAGVMMADGGASGVLAGLFVAALAIGLLLVALGMTYAPVSIAKLLEDEEDEHESPAEPGTNGHDLDDEGPP